MDVVDFPGAEEMHNPEPEAVIWELWAVVAVFVRRLPAAKTNSSASQVESRIREFFVMNSTKRLQISSPPWILTLSVF